MNWSPMEIMMQKKELRLELLNILVKIKLQTIKSKQLICIKKAENK